MVNLSWRYPFNTRGAFDLEIYWKTHSFPTLFIIHGLLRTTVLDNSTHFSIDSCEKFAFAVGAYGGSVRFAHTHVLPTIRKIAGGDQRNP